MILESILHEDSPSPFKNNEGPHSWRYISGINCQGSLPLESFGQALRSRDILPRQGKWWPKHLNVKIPISVLRRIIALAFRDGALTITTGHQLKGLWRHGVLRSQGFRGGSPGKSY